MFRAMELAAAFFEEQYASPAGAAARGYVERRGIGAAVRERFRVGYAPPRWDALSSHLAAHKIPPSDLERLGLVGVNERGRYDFFRDRVMLPVIDRQKRVIGFGGRLLDPEAKDRKYVNSPESPLFHKKESLYGLHAALDAIRRTGTADRRGGQLRRARAAPGGHRGGRRADGDGAHRGADRGDRSPRRHGRGGVRRRRRPASAPRRRRSRCSSRRASWAGASRGCPPGVDPDDFVRQPDRGADAFRRLVEGARPMLDQFIQDAASDANVPDRVTALRAITGLLVKVKDSTTRELYAGQLAGILKMEAQQVRRAMQEAAAAAQRQTRPPEAARRTGRAAPPRPVSRPQPRRPPASRRRSWSCWWCLARNPELLRSPEATRAGDLLVHPLARQLYRAAAEQAAEPATLDVPSWLETAAGRARRRSRSALMDDRFDGARRSGGLPAEIGDKARDSARGRRDSDEHAFAEGSAGTGG